MVCLMAVGIAVATAADMVGMAVTVAVATAEVAATRA